ncbi:hypothetical protein B0H17DRAFT_1203746 [Mycena rosella]|uniref:Ubiquitin-like protease family profile domain-containing protein n=1 Tax=Mycena rosella TaxID=1033263 RepID=A0AAD7DE61_MYCRO|nr:hypothetical protein B0H17DRAFT_1203746 [Mycena rosella]
MLIMMDKARLQLNGWLKALGIEEWAILRFDCDNGHQGLGFTIPFSIKFEILVLFRKLQRCRSWTDWDETKHIFHAGLAKLLSKEDVETLHKKATLEQEAEAGTPSKTQPAPLPSQTAPQPPRTVPQPKSKCAKAEGKTCLEVVQDYFDSNWFLSPWISMFTDTGMPADQSCDGTWNTDNWVESIFKQFSTIFLENKQNKRDANALEPSFGEFQVEPTFGEFRVVNSGGRPVKARPLHPWRRKTTQRIYATPGVHSYSPRFTKKRGPPKHRRLRWNSLFPATTRLVNARIAAYMARHARQRMMGVFRVNAPPADPPPGPPLDAQELDEFLFAGHQLSFGMSDKIPDNNDQFINQEDQSLHTFDVDCWRQNTSFMAREQGIIYLYGAPDVPFVERLRQLDWSQPLSEHQLRSAGLDLLADLVSTQTNGLVKHIVFYDLRHSHWTTFHHDLVTGQSVWYNSLSAPDQPTLPFNDQDQRVLQQFFLRPHLAGPVPVADPFNPLYLGLQHDSLPCGFWTVYIGLSIVLGFDPINEAISTLDIKELVGLLYLSFIGHEWGVPASLVEELFPVFHPRITFAHFPPDFIFSYQPKKYGHVIVNSIPEQPERTRPSSLPASVTRVLPADNTDTGSLDASYMQLLPGAGAHTKNTTWNMTPAIPRGYITVNALTLDPLINNGRVQDGMVDGYLSLLAAKVDPTPCAQSQGPRFVITDTVFGWSTQRSCPRKPWFDKVNRFTANLLVVAVYWELMTHWLLCSVFFKSHQIRIYDSITAGGTRRHRAVYDRMREMLMWEHKGQYNGIPLADSWAQFLSDSVIIVPQQDNTVDCGIYTIANAENWFTISNRHLHRMSEKSWIARNGV